MMSPESLVIDRYFRGVGRLVRATGSTDPNVRKRLNAMLTELASPADPQLDILRGIKRGDLSLLEVYDAYRRRALHTLATADTVKPLVAAMRAWRDGLDVGPNGDVSAKHHVSLGTSIAYLEGLESGAIVNDLPRLVRTLRQTLGKSYQRSFNLLRSAVQAFLRETVGKHHRLWQEVSAIPVKRIAKKPPRDTLTVARMWKLFPKPERDAVDQIAWTMATTGMHASEYWGAWTEKRDRVHIEGTKREGRVRDVPHVRALQRPPLSRDRWEKLMRVRATGVQPYDLRRTYARWLEDVGIPRTRRKIYLGHGASDVSDLYERHQITEYLTTDGAKLRAHVVKPQRKRYRGLRIA
jgi:hypothetical protein